MARTRNVLTTISVILIGVICLQEQINLSEGLSYDESRGHSDEASVVSLEERRFRRQADNGSTSIAPPATTLPPPTTTPNLLDYDIIHDDHLYYQSLMIRQSNIADYWVELEGTKGHQTLSDSHRTAVTASLPFSFLFYGHPVTNITIATGGFLYMSPFLHQWLTATQYIAPLMANFDTSVGNSSEVFFQAFDKKFVVEWRDVYLQDQSGSGTFQFQVILHVNGTIVFVYKQLPLRVYYISDLNHSVKAGLSDAFYYDTYFVDENGQRKVRRTIYEYHRVLLNTSEIREGTVVILHPQPTCNQYSDCESCVNAKIAFTCKWCGIINRCSDSVDWNRQEWLDQGCVHLAGSANCSLIPTRAPEPQTSTSSQSRVAIIVIVVVFILVLVGAVGGWVYYAYTHPTSASGMWLMEHRPSQMKAKLGNMKFWKRSSTAGDKYAVDSTA